MGLIHLPSHLTDEKAGPLRAETYRRLRRNWQYINELILFGEIEHHKRYVVAIYGGAREPGFVQAASLYHPDTVDRSLQHDGSGEEPGIKDDDGRWDTRPHAGRVVHVTTSTLRTWHAILESDDTPVEQSRTVFAVNQATAAVLDKLAAAPRIGELGLQFSAGWHETADRARGYFDADWGAPASWDDVILQGPNLHNGLPVFKSPNPTMRNNQDWSVVDLETLTAGAVPVTSYKPRGDRAAYDATYTHWTRTVLVDGPSASTSPQVAPRWVKDSETVVVDGREMRRETVSARGLYRVAWRRMAANTGERTLIPAIIPPGAAHTHLIYSAAELADIHATPLLQAFAGSIIADFLIRSSAKNDIIYPSFRQLPFIVRRLLHAGIALRSLRLNCVTDAYADLWAACWDEAFTTDEWASADQVRDSDELFTRNDAVALGAVGPRWTLETPLRVASDRRRALLEIDALVALSLGITADELSTIYRTQFPVLHGYDRTTYVYDANGRLVPNSVLSTWRKKENATTEDERTATHPGSGIAYVYQLPFVALDRETDLRAAYAEFERRLG